MISRAGSGQAPQDEVGQGRWGCLESCGPGKREQTLKGRKPVVPVRHCRRLQRRPAYVDRIPGVCAQCSPKGWWTSSIMLLSGSWM
jgi:hypothetical protein